MTEFLLHLVYDNPWNERELDQDNVERIALSVKADGMLERPLGRPNADQPGAVQLAFGHHRLAAYRTLRDLFAKDKANVGLQNPWAAIPVEVRPIDDRQMARYAIIENHHRSDPSAIEKARALLRLTTDPTIKISQAEAGELFGLGQTGVSHLVHLLDLPADVQALVASRELPEVPARHLVPLMKWRPDLVSKIAAQAVSDSETEHRAEAVDSAISDALQQYAQTLADHARPWPLEWPAKPLAIQDFDQTKGEPAEIPACRGCKFAIVRGGQAHCLRQACFNAKGRAWLGAQLTAASATLGIPVAKPGEAFSTIYAGSYYADEGKKAARLIRAKLPGLRLVANPNDPSRAHNLIDVTGSNSVALATTDQAAVNKYLNESNGKPAPKAKPANESPAAAERRKVAEKELGEERALERMAYNRSKADVLWLVEHTAELVAERTVAGGGLLLFAIDENRGGYFGSTEEMHYATNDLAKRTGVDKLGDGYGNGRSGWKDALRTSTPPMDQLRRQYLAYRKLTRDVAGGHNATDVYGDLARARKTCQSVATDTFGIELPAGWDTPPVHHTPINCWTCGRFSAAGAGKLTQADTKAGWVTEKDGAVHCPEHALKGKQSAIERPVERVGEWLSKSQSAILENPPTTTRKPKPAPTRTSAQALAQMRAAASSRTRPAKPAKPAKPIHVRSHTKPAAKKPARRKIARKGR